MLYLCERFVKNKFRENILTDFIEKKIKNTNS